MRVLLINPGWVKRVGNIWKNIASCMPPLGIAYIAGYLENKGVEVKILDLSAEQINSQEELEMTLKNMAFVPDYVGITATAPIINNAYETATICKNFFLPQKQYLEVCIQQSYLMKV